MALVIDGIRMARPVIGGRPYNIAVGGRLVWLPASQTVTGVRIVQADGADLPSSLPIGGTIRLGAVASYMDGRDSGVLTDPDDVTFTSLNGNATVNGNTLSWAHGGDVLVGAKVGGMSVTAEAIPAEWAPEQIIVEPSEVNLRVGGEPVELHVRVLPAEADQTVTVTVDPEGIVEVIPVEENLGGGGIP